MNKYHTRFSDEATPSWMDAPNPRAHPQMVIERAPAIPPSPIPQKSSTRMSKLSELATALNEIPRQVEAEAERALDRLSKARDAAFAGTQKIDGISTLIEQSARDIENFTAQLTNGGPPLE